MELLKGGRLTDLIKKRFKKGKFSDREASAMIKAILSAVSYMHEKGIVHRDLKPGRFLYFLNPLFLDNILVHDPFDLSTCKVVDFGLSAKYSHI